MQIWMFPGQWPADHRDPDHFLAPLTPYSPHSTQKRPVFYSDRTHHGANT